MTTEDAKDYAKNVSNVQRVIMSRASGTVGTLLEAIARDAGFDNLDVRAEADRLEAMNLLEIKQARTGGRFFHNYVILNERGLQVQALLIAKKKK